MDQTLISIKPLPPYTSNTPPPAQSACSLYEMSSFLKCNITSPPISPLTHTHTPHLGSYKTAWQTLSGTVFSLFSLLVISHSIIGPKKHQGYNVAQNTGMQSVKKVLYKSIYAMYAFRKHFLHPLRELITCQRDVFNFWWEVMRHFICISNWKYREWNEYTAIGKEDIFKAICGLTEETSIKCE